jgi:FtsZ-binding cell division protein ZapB
VGLAKQAEAAPVPDVPVPTAMWGESGSGSGGGGAGAGGLGVSGVDRLVEEVRQRIEQKVQQEKREEAETVKTGLRMEFERWQAFEFNRYITDTMLRTKELIGSYVSDSPEVREILARTPPQLRELIRDWDTRLSALPAGLTSIDVGKLMSNVKIGHRPEDFPRKDWEDAISVLAKEARLDDPYVESLNHPMFLHAMLLLASAPYNVPLADSSEYDQALLRRTAIAASLALNMPVEELQVRFTHLLTHQFRSLIADS